MSDRQTELRDYTRAALENDYGCYQILQEMYNSGTNTPSSNVLDQFTNVVNYSFSWLNATREDVADGVKQLLADWDN